MISTFGCGFRHAEVFRVAMATVQTRGWPLGNHVMLFGWNVRWNSYRYATLTPGALVLYWTCSKTRCQSSGLIGKKVICSRVGLNSFKFLQRLVSFPFSNVWF